MNNAKQGQALLLASLNRAAAPQGFSFLPSDLSFSAVSASENPNREVQVTYTATPESLFEGAEVAYYDRLDLTSLFANAGVASVEMVKGATTTADVVTALNTRFDMGFTAEDFDLSLAIGAEDDVVVLTALPGSYAFKGALSVSLVVDKTPLNEAVVNPELDSMEPDAAPVDSEAQPV